MIHNPKPEEAKILQVHELMEFTLKSHIHTDIIKQFGKYIKKVSVFREGDLYRLTIIYMT